jgi:hypothetical protein
MGVPEIEAFLTHVLDRGGRGVISPIDFAPQIFLRAKNNF